MSSMPLLKSAADLECRVRQVGFLPYFRSSLPGFSVEEMVQPSLLWDTDDGPWMWKGEVLRGLETAYGKLCHGRAAYIALDLLPAFLSMRRQFYYTYRRDDIIEADARVLDVLRSHESLLSGELKKLCGYTRTRKTSLTPLERLLDDTAATGSDRRPSFDSTITRLMMGGLMVIADFEYRHDSRGNRLGWGVARYTTPEALYGADIVAAGLTASEAMEVVARRILDSMPGLQPLDVYRLINY